MFFMLLLSLFNWSSIALFQSRHNRCCYCTERALHFLRASVSAKSKRRRGAALLKGTLTCKASWPIAVDESVVNTKIQLVASAVA